MMFLNVFINISKIENMFKSGSIDLEELSKLVLEEV